MAQKFYAVRKGKKTGIFLTWDECKRQVTGFSGAEYKSFPNKEGAEAFLSLDLPTTTGETVMTEDGIPYKENTAIAYVDGSYKAATREFASGAVLFYNKEKITFSEKFDDPELAEMRNVAGEITGSMIVIRYCIENDIKAVEIYHDYEGISKWANGLWKANKSGTKNYAEFCRQAREHVNISFVKVKGHSGDRYNDEADILAKKALGIL
ncbi:ribonuclease H1 domain-containing protein [Scatolibacter rhodanostii]|uniref:ribonuclease H1 domain-containing protein n=1 Tax=Scatolibacter rhodanostii TaxID=2014781 RepID=UPI000C06C398|nr:ribonuclease H family protein [Scatolibacter rhodanostii]